MAFFFEERNRLVIPNWRSFSNTAKIGELNGSRKLRIEKSFTPDISDLVEDWLENQTIGVAGDLLGTAIVCNRESDPNVIAAAKFIMNNKNYISKELRDTADLILRNDTDVNQPILDQDNFEAFQEKANLYFIYRRIREIRARLRNNPSNSILWVEMARFYAILGQNEKAERAIKNAMNLSPDNRFVLRSMSRFFVHCGKTDYAHDFIKKLPITKFDPWITATEISLATKRGRYSKFIKQGTSVVNSSNFHPFNISELNSSLGTLEMNSSFKKSKKFFKDSLINPNDNVLAQAEWASHKNNKLLSINPNDFDVSNTFEANARNSSDQGDWEEAIDYAKMWFLDMPFSRGAIMFGSEIAANNLNNHKEAAYIYKAGITSHPNDPQMLNNLVYSLCLDNNLKEAELFLQKFNSIINNTYTENKICMIATRGLYFYRKGYFDLGDKFYSEAIELAAEKKNQKLANQAFVNYVREMKLSKQILEPEFTEKIDELREKSNDKLIIKVINEIDSLNRV